MAQAILEAPQPQPTIAERQTTETALRRVLHLVNGEHYAGAERVQDLLALRLPEFGFEVTFVCLKPDQFPRRRRAREARLLELPMRSRLDVAAAVALSRIVRQEDYLLIHAHTPRSALVGRLASLLAGVPFVYHVHSPAARDSTHRWLNRASALAERAALTGTARLIAVSESLRNDLEQHGQAARKIAVVHNGVPSIALAERGRPRGTWTLGTLALFRPRKGIEVLLEALARLHAEGMDVRLRAVGEFEMPQYRAEVFALAERLGVCRLIDWAGFCDDVAAELAQMDLVVLPSLFGEGLPMVVLEAMAAGVPVVASRVEGVPEAIGDGREGVLVEPGDPQALARGVRRIVDGSLDWQSLATAAKQRHAEMFSDRAMARHVADVYREVLD